MTERHKSILYNSELFTNISHQEVDIIISKCDLQHFHPDQIIIKEGERGDFRGILISGYAQVMKNCDKIGSKSSYISYIGPGEIIGLLRFVGDEDDHVTIKTMSSCNVLRLCDDILETESEEVANVLRFNILRSIINRLKERVSQIEILQSSTSLKKLIKALLFFSIKYGQEDTKGHIIVDVGIGRQHLAEMLGMRAEEVSRLCSKLIDSGAIVSRYRSGLFKFTILNHETLVEMLNAKIQKKKQKTHKV